MHKVGDGLTVVEFGHIGERRKVCTVHEPTECDRPEELAARRVRSEYNTPAGLLADRPGEENQQFDRSCNCRNCPPKWRNPKPPSAFIVIDLPNQIIRACLLFLLERFRLITNSPSPPLFPRKQHYSILQLLVVSISLLHSLITSIHINQPYYYYQSQHAIITASSFHTNPS